MTSKKQVGDTLNIYLRGIVEIHPRLHLIRGVPGSGKTSFAHTLGVPDHFEADQWFAANGGFDKEKLSVAHKWCQDQAFAAMRCGRHVVVSNTFSMIWEMQPYLDMAKETRHLVIVTTMTGRFENTHHVSQIKVNQIARRFEPYPPVKPCVVIQ